LSAAATPVVAYPVYMYSTVYLALLSLQQSGQEGWGASCRAPLARERSITHDGAPIIVAVINLCSAARCVILHGVASKK